MTAGAAHLLAVDGNSLGHRAWHAIGDHEDPGPWLTHGVVRMLASAWMYGPFDAVVVALDGPGSLRRQRYDGYKAQRPPTDPRLHAQLDQMADLLERCGITVLRTDGYEADDLLAGAVAGCRRIGARCTLLSSDRDLIALVSDDVTLIRPRSSMDDLEFCDPGSVRAAYGVWPGSYLELAALRGDPSDNLPGVRGVGHKTAARLLTSWGSIEAIYAGLRELPPRLAKALRAGRELVERNLALMAPMDDVEVDARSVLERGLDLGRVSATLKEAGLHIAAAALRNAVELGPPPPIPPPPEEDPTDYGPPARAPARAPVPVAVTGVQIALFD